MGFNRLKQLFLKGFLLILALPLLNWPPWFSPPDWGKTIVFRIAMSILIFLRRKHLLKYAKVFVEIENQNIGWQKKPCIRTRPTAIGKEKRKREILELSDKPRLTLPATNLA